MVIFRMEMDEWKRQLEEKKEQIMKMPRKKWSEDREYQGEEKDGKKQGFGIWYFVSGKSKGNQFEGEFKDDKFHGKGI